MILLSNVQKVKWKHGTMKKPKPKLKPTRLKERLVAEIHPDLLNRLRTDRVETRRPVNHIVEEILSRHYDTEPPVVTG
jgi:hypothetical protein